MVHNCLIWDCLCPNIFAGRKFPHRMNMWARIYGKSCESNCEYRESEEINKHNPSKDLNP